MRKILSVSFLRKEIRQKSFFRKLRDSVRTLRKREEREEKKQKRRFRTVWKTWTKQVFTYRKILTLYIRRRTSYMRGLRF